MTHYIALVQIDPDSSFGVQFPDVPRFFSAADSMDDLVGNAMEDLNLWAEDEAIPKARAVEQIEADPDICAELAAGAFLVSVPSVPNEIERSRIGQRYGITTHPNRHPDEGRDWAWLHFGKAQPRPSTG
jgi:predicted RNase H-like HicB family nuclease